MILMVKKLFKHFLEKPDQKVSNIEKVIKKKKKTSYTSNGKDMIIHLKVGLIKIMLYINEPILF